MRAGWDACRLRHRTAAQERIKALLEQGSRTRRRGESTRILLDSWGSRASAEFRNVLSHVLKKHMTTDLLTIAKEIADRAEPSRLNKTCRRGYRHRIHGNVFSPPHHRSAAFRLSSPSEKAYTSALIRLRTAALVPCATQARSSIRPRVSGGRYSRWAVACRSQRGRRVIAASASAAARRSRTSAIVEAAIAKSPSRSRRRAPALRIALTRITVREGPTAIREAAGSPMREPCQRVGIKVCRARSHCGLRILAAMSENLDLVRSIYASGNAATSVGRPGGRVLVLKQQGTGRAADATRQMRSKVPAFPGPPRTSQARKPLDRQPRVADLGLAE